ncbi:MAG: AAA family ATPase, partial [Acidaminococcus fermentans]
MWGPNGSGKSNISDAIRWVLGEQSVKYLRGTKMEDVIFAGSSGRRPMGMAEVDLVFDNTDHSLPVDFDEVFLQRRVFRSGDSEYIINGKNCRLKDVVALFADTGLGRGSLSIIGQNKIDEILNSRPEDRRSIFEEAAGIAKYRLRKKEALRKLDDTAANLLRIQDIQSEIENQLVPLEAAAEKARQYGEISGRLRQVKVTRLLTQLGALEGEKTRLKEKIRSLEGQLKELVD